MTLEESTVTDVTVERNGAARSDGMDESPTDHAEHRSMSLAEIREAHADLADAYYRFDWMDRLFVGRARRRQFGDVDGRVLDVACGTGPNFRYLPPTAAVVGVDISPEMLSKARDRLSSLALDGEVEEMDAQDLAFADDSFDAVISSLSTCTFPDPIAALQEMERVCAPDGRILLLEHGLSSVGPVARFQEWRAEPHYEKAGCRWTQEPLELVEEAGLVVEESRTGYLGMVTAIEIDPSP